MNENPFEEGVTSDYCVEGGDCVVGGARRAQRGVPGTRYYTTIITALTRNH